MEALNLFLVQASVGVWLGAIIFHSAVVAPATFGTLDGDDAGRFLRTLFPRFFKFGLACGLLALLGVGWSALAGYGLAGPLITGLAVTMMVLQGVSLGMVPAINAARDAGDTARFGRLHGINVLLTVVILLCGLALLFRAPMH